MAEAQKPKNNLMVAFGLYGGIGIQLVISVVLGLVAGRWLDGKFDSEPWLAIVGIVLGTIAGFYNLVRILNSKKG